MFDDFYFTGARMEAESSLSLALPYDYYEHAVLQNKRDDESRREHRDPKEVLSAISCHEACERCGKNLAYVYIWNGKRLCKGCLEEEQEAWVLVAGDFNNARQRIQSKQIRKRIGLPPPGSSTSGFLAYLGLFRTRNGAIILEPKTPEKRAELLAGRRSDKKQVPKSEKPMGAKKKLHKPKNNAGSRI